MAPGAAAFARLAGGESALQSIARLAAAAFLSAFRADQHQQLGCSGSCSKEEEVSNDGLVVRGAR